MEVRKSLAAAIFRSKGGAFLGAYVLIMDGVMEPSSVEVVSYREVLGLARDQGLSSLTIASDLSGVIRSI